MVPQSASNDEASSSNSSTDAVPSTSPAHLMQPDDDGVDIGITNESPTDIPNTSFADLMQFDDDDGVDLGITNESSADLTSTNSMEQNVTDNGQSSNNTQQRNDMNQSTSNDTQSTDIESETAMGTTNRDETSSSNVPLAVMEERLHSLRVRLGLVNTSPETPSHTQTLSQPELSSPTTSQTKTKSKSPVQLVSSLPPTRQAEVQTQSQVQIRPASSTPSTSFSMTNRLHPQTENDPAVEPPQLSSILRALPALPQVLRIRGRRVSTPPSMVAINELPDDEEKENIHKKND